MATDFAVFLRRFLTGHLAGLRGYSPNTIASYRDAFKLLICYFRDERYIPPEKLTLEQIDAAAITGFLALAAHQPAQLRVDLQPAAGRDRLVLHLDANPGPGPHGLLPGHPRDPRQQTRPAGRGPPDRRADPATARRCPTGPPAPARRDATLLATLYDTAARVQELADLTVRDIRLDHPAMAALTGKGRKTRHVPLDANTTALLAAYLAERHLDGPGREDHPVFFNQHRAKLSRGGIAWILRKYQTRAADPALANAHLSPHVLRHSRAMHLYDAAFRCPTSATSSATSTCPPPRSTRGPPPRPNAKPSKPSTPTSSPPTWPNGTRTPNCSTGSPASDRARDYAQRSVVTTAPTSGNTPSAAHNPALFIGRHALPVARQHRPVRAGRALRPATAAGYGQ